MSQNETIQNMAVSHECCNSCGGACPGLSALARAIEDTHFAALDEKLIANLKASLNLSKKNSTPPPKEDAASG